MPFEEFVPKSTPWNDNLSWADQQEGGKSRKPKFKRIL